MQRDGLGARPASRRADSGVVIAFPLREGATKLPSQAGWWMRIANARTYVEAWCTKIDLAPDLAVDIGSRTWLRGMATLIGLSASAIALSPSFTAIDPASAMPLDLASQDELGVATIRPLARGGDTGRAMRPAASVHLLANVPERASLQLASILGQGDSLARMLQRAGLGDGDITQVIRLIGQALPGGTIAPTTQFDITLGRRAEIGAPRSLTTLNFKARFDLELTIARSGSELTLVRHPIRIDATPLRVRGTVGSSLYRSARNAGAPVSAIQSYLQALDKHVSFENDLKAGDQFDMVVSYRRSASGERQVGDLLYAGVERAGKPTLQLLRWGKDGQMAAATAVAQVRSMAIGQPVAGRITSSYGARRHPILGYVRMHAGIDFGAAYGSPIYAVADGVVTFAGRHGGHGNYVRLQHAGGLGTGYGHMSRIAVGNGTQVRAGQVIGFVGSTGLSTGPHLHFEAYRDGHTINPAGIVVASAPQIDGRERDAFKARMNALLGIAPGAALGPVSGAGG